MKYPYLLFDAGDTLFDFSKAYSTAFSVMCRKYDVPYSPETYQVYHEINLVLWEAFNHGEITKEFLTLERYVRFLNALELDRDAAQCNWDYLQALGRIVYPLPYAGEVCRELVHCGHKLYIITNAVASVQRSRLSACSFGDVFTAAFISEEAGAAKPHKAYYDYVRRQVPEITPENTLVIGDSLSTDIQGANNAGLPCCWFNPSKKAAPENLRIDHTITDLRQLLDIV